MGATVSLQLPRFTIGERAFDGFSDEMGCFGTKAAIIYGEKAYQASKEYLLPALDKAGIQVIVKKLYGHEAVYENAEAIISESAVRQADFIVGVGGGKCMDTVKFAADRLNKPLFTIPTVASNCAPITKISIMYQSDGSFLDIPRLKHVPVHCFIHPQIILSAPVKYLWAGIGDAMAKNVECEFSAKGEEHLDYGSELGRLVSQMCFNPMLKDGEQAMADAKKGLVTDALLSTILNIIISPGITSLAVHANYNGAAAHALFYGLTNRNHIEINHLHGEVVSYGSLVNLMLDKQMSRFKQVYEFNQAIGLPTCLEDLEISKDDLLDDVLDIAMNNQEMQYLPYPVTKDMLYRAILELEEYNRIHKQ